MYELPLSAIVPDILSGMGDEELMKKHGLSMRGLRLVLQMLVEKNAFEPWELAEFSPAYREVASLLDFRRFPRVYVPGPLAPKIHCPETKQVGYVRDISRNGFRAVGIKAEVGQELTLFVSLKRLEKRGTFGFRAVCRWSAVEGKRKKYPMGGFEIVRISAKARVEWDEVIDFIQSRIEQQEAPTRTRLSESGLFALRGTKGRDRVSRAFSGSLDGVDILEVVQLLLLNGQRIVLSIQSPAGHESLVHLRDGKIVHAVHGELQGEEAFYASMILFGGQFRTEPWTELAHETIDVPGDSLLMEAARRRDDPVSVNPSRCTTSTERLDEAVSGITA